MTVTNQRNMTNTQLTINDNPILKTNSTKFLGVYIDEDLKFNAHTEHISKKISKSIGILYRLKNLVPRYILHSLYNSFILPYLNYGILVWGPTSSTHLDRLKKLQKRAVRIICDQPFLAHSAPLFDECQILKLNELYKYNLAIHFYKTRQHENIMPQHAYNTRDRNNVTLPYHRLTKTQQSISFQGAKVWRDLPAHIRHTASLRRFKTSAKQYFLDSQSQQ